MPICSRVVGWLGSKALYFSTAAAKRTSFASPSLSASMPYQLEPLLLFLLGLLSGWLKGGWWDQKRSPPKNVIVSRGADDIRLSARGRVHRVWGRRFVCGLRRPHRFSVSITNCRRPRWVPFFFSHLGRADMLESFCCPPEKAINLKSRYLKQCLAVFPLKC